MTQQTNKLGAEGAWFNSFCRDFLQNLSQNAANLVCKNKEQTCVNKRVCALTVAVNFQSLGENTDFRALKLVAIEQLVFIVAIPHWCQFHAPMPSASRDCELNWLQSLEFSMITKHHRRKITSKVCVVIFKSRYFHAVFRKGLRIVSDSVYSATYSLAASYLASADR